ncbi:hypothetical protein GCM10014715_72400 [Streptomyces spiralis]|uniref:Transposase IS4-like domain-containing protein n=1 Tax=Streptomyces spiralis TaxID=66376 RepID=A0A919E0H0_9ACTN|nr:hypothetical protein GCM10014715_72400 [Streptomyces spiralis]
MRTPVRSTRPGKKIVGRKRNIVTDTLGLLLAVLVTAASVQDSVAGTRLLDQVVGEHPGIRKVWVDGGYRQHLVEHAATLGIDMEITARIPGTRGITEQVQRPSRRNAPRCADSSQPLCDVFRSPGIHPSGIQLVRIEHNTAEWEGSCHRHNLPPQSDQDPVLFRTGAKPTTGTDTTSANDRPGQS